MTTLATAIDRNRWPKLRAARERETLPLFTMRRRRRWRAELVWALERTFHRHQNQITFSIWLIMSFGNCIMILCRVATQRVGWGQHHYSVTIPGTIITTIIIMIIIIVFLPFVIHIHSHKLQQLIIIMAGPAKSEPSLWLSEPIRSRTRNWRHVKFMMMTTPLMTTATATALTNSIMFLLFRVPNQYYHDILILIQAGTPSSSNGVSPFLFGIYYTYEYVVFMGQGRRPLNIV